MLHLILLFALAMSHGFLLQTNSLSNSGAVGSQQYITKSELYDTLQNEINFVRNDINFVWNDLNKKLDLLTSQLQQMLASFQQQITGQRCHNDTLSVKSLELKYSEVIGNYTQLWDKFISLEIKNSKQEIELMSMKNKTKELEDEIVNLNSFKNSNQLTDFRLLQQEVQSISAQTHSLAVNEQARIQDFQALYNSLKDHEVNEVGIIQSLNLTLCQNIQSFEISTNASLSNVITRMSESENHQNRKIEELENSVNVSLRDIRQQIARNSEKVVLTACAESSEFGPQPPGYIIKYNDIRTQVNVNSLSSFRSSGMFSCEKEGVYLVSAWDLSKEAESAFSITKNGNLLASAYIAGSSGIWYTSTAVVAIELHPNDYVWVQVRSQMYVHADQKSCLTIVKVK